MHQWALLFLAAPVVYKTDEVTATAHELAKAMAMRRSLDTIALHVGTDVLSKDPSQKRRKIMSPWIVVSIPQFCFYFIFDFFGLVYQTLFFHSCK